MNFKRFNPAWNTLPIQASAVFSLAAVIGLGLLLIGCGNGNTVTGTSMVRVFNAYIPAAGSDATVTVTSNSTSLTGAANAPFGQLANGGTYVSRPSGKFIASAQPAGASAAFQFQHEPTLIAGDFYTVVAAGQAGQTGTLVPRLITIPHNSTSISPIPSGDVAVRVVNLSLNPNAVSLYTSTSGTLVPLDPIVTNIPYGYNSQTNTYVFLPAAKPANLALVDNATQNVLTLSDPAAITTNTFTAGQAYTLFVYGQPGNSAQPLGATWVADQASP